MPRWTLNVSSWSIALKHFLFLFIGTLLLFGLLAWLNLKDAEQLFRKQVVSDSEIIIDRTNLYLNAYLDNVQSILLMLRERPDLLDEDKEGEAIELLRQYAGQN
ncbi:histidine kinase, partial [Paenibacillus sepulcri]|nr:histidine kinase [Paenibacillus sepulcri]